MPFVFVDGAGPKPGENPRLIEVPVGLSSQEELVRTLAGRVPLPITVADDWEAFSDSLRTEAGQNKSMLLAHSDLPLVDNPKHCRNYLRALSNATYGERLSVAFPIHLKPEIMRLLSTHEPEKREPRPYERLRFDANDFSFHNHSYERLRTDFPDLSFDGIDQQRIYSINFHVPFNTMIDRSILRDGQIVELFDEYEWFRCRAVLLRVSDQTWDAAPIKGTFVYPENVPDDGGPLKMPKE